jgi:hypothetical protein
MTIERLALDAIAGDDADIGLDTLRCMQDELYLLHAGLTNDQALVSRDRLARHVGQMIHRIDLAFALAAPESEAAE